MKHNNLFVDAFRLTNTGMVVALALIAGATMVVGDFLLGMVDVFTIKGVVYVIIIVLSGGLLLSLASLCVALDNAWHLLAGRDADAW